MSACILVVSPMNLYDREAILLTYLEGDVRFLITHPFDTDSAFVPIVAGLSSRRSNWGSIQTGPPVLGRLHAASARTD